MKSKEKGMKKARKQIARPSFCSSEKEDGSNLQNYFLETRQPSQIGGKRTFADRVMDDQGREDRIGKKSRTEGLVPNPWVHLTFGRKEDDPGDVSLDKSKVGSK